jgi:hypothetical protein
MVAPFESPIRNPIPKHHSRHSNGDLIQPDIVFGIYPEDEISFYHGIGNLQKQDCQEFISSGLLDDDYKAIGGWWENDI